MGCGCEFDISTLFLPISLSSASVGIPTRKKILKTHSYKHGLDPLSPRQRKMSETNTYTQPPYVYIVRKESFSAAHRLHSPHLSDSENKALFGVSNHPHGFGHNYNLTVTLRGRIDLKSGMFTCCYIQA
jgi:hypothetical protein